MTGTPFGTTPDGRSVELFTLTSSSGVEVRTINYGCALVSIRVPDREGRLSDVLLGCDTLDGYLANRSYVGAVCGRYANRIAEGRFSLDGKAYELATNNGVNHLHGGRRGFDKYVWTAEPLKDGVPGIVFSHASPDGDEGYPGTLRVRVTYTLTERNELAIEYHATTDKPTILNLTNHSYFNLAGAGSGEIVDHEILINADHFTPVGETLIPTGDIAPVAGTPFDFRRLTRIGARISDPHVQIQRGRGYDHNFVLNKTKPGEVSHAARLVHPPSGRVLDVHTTEPGMQFYSGNYLDGSIMGKGGRPCTARSGLCLETQHFPDTPNKPHFPSALLRPGHEFRSRTVFAFGTL